MILGIIICERIEINSGILRVQYFNLCCIKGNFSSLKALEAYFKIADIIKIKAVVFVF